MVDVDMERWRSYFGKAGADIWTVIQQAINLAAMDYPKDFRDRRGEIAETLFARNLLQLHCRDVKDEPCLILEEGEVRDGETGTRQMPEAVADADDHVDHGNDAVERHLHSYHDEAEALTDELEEETLVLREVNSIKETIEDVDQPENVVLEALQRLQYTQISVEALKATEIGKQVNSLRKHTSKRVRAIVKELVRQWKVLVDEWVSSARDVTAATTTTTTTTTAVKECGEFPEAGNHEEGLPSPPLDEGALLEARASSVELSQLFSFIDGEICGQPKDRDKPSSLVEPFMKDNSSRSQSGSMLTDSSDFDTKASTSHPWGLRTPEERGSATRDMYPSSDGIEKKVSALKGQTVQRDKGQRGLNHDGGMPVSKSFTNCSGPGRPANDMSKVKITSGSVITGKSASVHKTVAMHASSGDKASVMKSDKYKADQKLEIAKRKLHQGYQQAENAKKQRTVQVLDFSDLPKAGQVQGKVNPPVQTKAGPQNGHWNQNRRYA